MPAERYTIKIGIIMALITTASSSNHNILIYIFEQLHMQHVATIPFLVRYFFVFIGTLLAPGFKCTLKTQLILATTGCFFNYLLSTLVLITNNHTIILLGITLGYTVDGFAMSVLFISQGRYCHLICQLFDIHENRGHVLGLYQMFFSLSLLTGSITTYTCIGFFSNITYFVCLTLLLLLALLGFIFFLEDLQIISEQQLGQLGDNEKDNESRNRIEEIIQTENQHQNAEHYSVLASLSKTFSTMTQICYILPLFFYEGLGIGIKMNQVSHLIPNSYPLTQKNKLVGLCMVCTATGCFASGYIVSKATDVFNTYCTSKMVIIGFFMTCLVHILAVSIENIILSFFAAFCWGFFTNSFTTIVNVICSKHLGGSKEVLSIHKFIYALSLTIFEGAMTWSHNNLPKLGFLTIGVVSLGLFLLVSKLPPSKQIIKEIQEDKQF